jgi:hypothetical protein
MADGTTDKGLIDECYDLINAFSHDEQSLADANTAATGLTNGVAAAAALPGGSELAIPAAALTMATPPVIAEHVIMPLEATALFADCVPPNTFINEVIGNHSDPIGQTTPTSEPPAQESFGAPVNDGFLVMDSTPNTTNSFEIASATNTETGAAWGDGNSSYDSYDAPGTSSYESSTSNDSGATASDNG